MQKVRMKYHSKRYTHLTEVMNKEFERWTHRRANMRGSEFRLYAEFAKVMEAVNAAEETFEKFCRENLVNLKED